MNNDDKFTGRSRLNILAAFLILAAFGVPVLLPAAFPDGLPIRKATSNIRRKMTRIEKMEGVY